LKTVNTALNTAGLAGRESPTGKRASTAVLAPFLDIQSCTKRFDQAAAVDDVSIQIERGEIFALLGPSGCGKSTLLRMLAGFEAPSHGRILLDGQDITALPPYERPINMMFQSYALFPHLSVWENIAFGLKRSKRSTAEIATRVEEMLSLVQLKALAKRKPHQLSGGQQQRVALARSLALEPRLLLLDEPLGALDRKLRGQTQFELKSILKRVGVTCVLVTHDQEEAMMMADRIAVLNRGKILQVGVAQDIYETPNSRFVADFIGSVNLLDGILKEDEPDHCVIETAHGNFYVGHGVSGVMGMAVSIALRPEKLRLLPPKVSVAEYNAFPARIVDQTYFGSSSVYRVVVRSGLVLQVTQANSERHSELLAVGADVTIECAPESVVVLTS
jgi:putrescine transport system ATP-binding protein